MTWVRLPSAADCPWSDDGLAAEDVRGLLEEGREQGYLTSDHIVDATGLEGIFTTALAAEKDSILLYLGTKDLVPESLGRGKIEAIIREEMRHIRILGEKLAAL